MTSAELYASFRTVAADTHLDLGLVTVFGCDVAGTIHCTTFRPHLQTACGVDLRVVPSFDYHFGLSDFPERSCKKCVWEDYYVSIEEKRSYSSPEEMRSHRRAVLAALPEPGPIGTLEGLDELCQAVGVRELVDLPPNDSLTHRILEAVGAAMSGTAGKEWRSQFSTTSSNPSDGCLFLVDVEPKPSEPSEHEENMTLLLDLELQKNKKGRFLSLVSPEVHSALRSSRVFEVYNSLPVDEETPAGIIETVAALYDPWSKEDVPEKSLQAVWDAAQAL